MSHTLPFVVLMCSALGCSDETPGSASPGRAGAGGTLGGVATAGAAGAVGIAGGGQATGGSGGTAGAGGLVAGGVAGQLAGNTSGAGGAGGAVGGAGGTAGSGGALVAIAAEVDKFRLECPCIDADHFGLDKSDTCDATPAVDRQTHVKHLGGDPNVTYDVTLHVRGNTEPNIFVNGQLEQDRFYIGGETSTPPYTAYMLSVAEPKQTYFFNHNPTTGHIHFLIDYQVVIPMQGGTTLTFEVNGGKSTPDGHGVSNRESLVVAGVPPAPAPFNGQFVQFDVVSVKAR